MDKRNRKIYFSLKALLFFIIISALFFVLAHADDVIHYRQIQISADRLKLSAEEQAWLNARPIIGVAGPRSFPPFHFFENDNEQKGISADYLSAILKPLGIQFNVNKNLPWPQVLKLAKEKKIDLIVCAGITEDRMKYLNFSEPYLSFPLVIVSRKEADFIGGIEDLHGKKLAVIKKNLIAAWLKKDEIKYIAHYVDSPLNGLKAVSFDQADAQIENLAAASYLIQKYGLTNLKIAAPTPYENYNLHMAVRKDLPELVSIINKSLEAMEPSEHSEIKNKWLSVRYEFGIKKVEVLKWIALVLIFSGTILTLMLIWNRKLKKESQERKLAQVKLAASERKYRYLFNNAPTGMYEISFKENRFVSVNEVMCSYSGYSEEEFMAINPIDLLAPESQNVFLERLGELSVGKNVSDAIEYNILKKDESQLCVTLNSDFSFEDGQPISAQVVVHDITLLKEIEKEKIKAQKIAGEHEKLALVGKIAGKMAHDFNNILGIIMGNAEISMLKCKEPKIKKSLELIFEQTLRGRNLTKNLVAFAKDQEPKQEFFIIYEKIDLVLSLLKKDLEGIELIRIDKPGVPELLADPGMIEHTIVNLVQNAIHAVSQSDTPQIIFRTFCSGDRICFEIEDNGCGIPEEHIQKIYDPAFSLKGSRDFSESYTPGIKGTGYGMSNIRKYIEQHKGDIKVESTVGVGTKFTINLPAIQKELSPEEKTWLKTRMVGTGKYILLVEDETDISDVLYRVLSQEPLNHKVDVAPDAESAKALIEKNTYDLISLDYVLSGKTTGMDIYQYIREKDKKVPVLFISGNFTFIESIKTLKQKDAYIDHLSKPCQNKDYVACINQLMQKI